MDLPFCLLQEELTPCYTKMGGGTVVKERLISLTFFLEQKQDQQ